jgi:hypothetical protein
MTNGAVSLAHFKQQDHQTSNLGGQGFESLRARHSIKSKT